MAMTTEDTPKQPVTPKDQQAQLTWVDTTQKIAEIVSRSPPILPILLRCASYPRNTALAQKISVGDIMKLIRLQPVDVVEAKVHSKSIVGQNAGDLEEYNDLPLPSSLAIPKSLNTLSFEVVRGSVRYAFSSTPMGSDDPSLPSSPSMNRSKPALRFKSVLTLSEQLPRFVKVIRTTKQIRKNTNIIEGHVLEVLGVHTPWATKDRFLSCRIDEPNGQVCKLDLRWKGVYDAIPDTKRYFIQDLLRMYRLPVVVRLRDFTVTDWLPRLTHSHLKAIKTLALTLTLEREVTMEYVMGINEGLSVGDHMSFTSGLNVLVMSKHIDIEFVTSSDMTMNPKKYEDVMNHFGHIKDSLVSLISKDIYLSEFGSPMVAILPLSKLQPKPATDQAQALSSSKTEENISDSSDRRRSSHHYIDLDMFISTVPECSSSSEGGNDDVDSYETLNSILHTMAQSSQNVSSQCPNPISNVRFALDRTSSLPQTPRFLKYSSPHSTSNISSPSNQRSRCGHDESTADKSHYQIPRQTYSGDENDLQDNDDIPMGGDALLPDVSHRKSATDFKTSSPNAFPQDSLPPPPIPRRWFHNSHPRLEYTASASSTSPPKPRNLDDPSPGIFRTSRVSDVTSMQKDGKEPGDRSDQRNHSLPNIFEQSESLFDLNLNHCLSLPSRFDPCDSLKIPSPTPSFQLPSPPSDIDVSSLDDLPLADFPPPLPPRSPSLESIGSNSTNDNDSLNSSFREGLKSVLSKSVIHFPTMPKRQDSANIEIRRTHSCSPTRLRHRNAVTRQLPDLPAESEAHSIEFPLSQSHSILFTRSRQSRGGDHYEVRPPPPLPRNARSSSMDNLSMDGQGTISDHSADKNRQVSSALHPSQDSTREPIPDSTQSLLSRTSTAKHRGYALPGLQASSLIPVAPIAPRPSVMTDDNLPFDGRHRLHRHLSTRVLTADLSSMDEGSDDDSYLNPHVGLPMSHRSHCRSRGRSAFTAAKPQRESSQIMERTRNRPRMTRQAGSYDGSARTMKGDIKSIREIPSNISSLSCEQVAQTLVLLNVPTDIIDEFKTCQMNGELLNSMTPDILMSQFKMSQFYAIKVHKFVNGWRP